MTQTIAPPHPTAGFTTTWVRMALAILAAMLLLAAFATGRVTAAGDDSTGKVVDAPAATDAVAQPFECPPSRPPVC